MSGAFIMGGLNSSYLHRNLIVDIIFIDRSELL